MCELLAKALRASVITVSHSTILLDEAPVVVSENSMMSRLRKGLGLEQRETTVAGLSSPLLSPTGAPVTRPPLSTSPRSVTGDWKDKGKTSLAALKVLGYFSSGCDKNGGNSKTNFILGNEVHLFKKN